MTSSRSSRILIADGSPVELQALSEGLAEAGFAVDQATSAREIFAKVAELFYDVVVTDLNIPEIDGLTLLTQLTEHSPDTAVIVLTGHGPSNRRLRP
jgi:DNA-binding NtrC family response regulator